MRPLYWEKLLQLVLRKKELKKSALTEAVTLTMGVLRHLLMQHEREEWSFKYYG